MRGAHEYLLTEGKNEGIKKLKKKKKECKHKELLKDNLNTGSIISSQMNRHNKKYGVQYKMYYAKNKRKYLSVLTHLMLLCYKHFPK